MRTTAVIGWPTHAGADMSAERAQVLSTEALSDTEHRLASSLALCHQVEDKMCCGIAAPMRPRSIEPPDVSPVPDSASDGTLAAE